MHTACDLALAPRDGLGGTPEDQRGKHHQWRDEQREHCQLNVQRGHDRDHAGQRQQRIGWREEECVDDVVDDPRVAGNARHRVAHRIARMEQH